MEGPFKDVSRYETTFDLEGGRHIVLETTEFFRSHPGAPWVRGKVTYATAKGIPVDKVCEGVYLTCNESPLLLTVTSGPRPGPSADDQTEPGR